MAEKDDDFILLYAGATGTGKSNLMLWGYEVYDPEGNSSEFIGLDRQTHATALKKASEKKHPRFCGDDEANVSRRDAMSKYNKERIDLYLAIRGLQIFHAWCNPSVDILDKPFIEERIKGLVFVKTKDVKRPRVYQYFTKKGLLKMLEEQGNLKQETIKKHGDKYAYYEGWFRKYEGDLLKPYLEKKEERMSTKVNNFYESFAEAWLNKSSMCKKLDCHHNTVTKRHNELVEQGLLKEGEHYRINETTGFLSWNEASLDYFKLPSLAKGKKALIQASNINTPVRQTKKEEI